MKQAVLFVTLVFLSTFVVIGWTNGTLRGSSADRVLGSRSSFWNQLFGKWRKPAAVPTRGLLKPTPSTVPDGATSVSDDPETDLTNLEQELRSLEQEMNALKLDAQVQ